MKRGIALMEANTLSSLEEAVACFDQAIEMRRQLPLKDNSFFVYCLAAGLLNRADALTKMGSAQAVQGYDESLRVINGLPFGANPLFVRRLAIAWSNRGLALQARHSFKEAEQSFETAINVLLKENATAIKDRDYLLAAALMNLANLQVRGSEITQAKTTAKEAIVLADQDQYKDPHMAEIGLKARHILCQTIAVLIKENVYNRLVRKELIDEATDAVDEGMALARYWQQRGLKRFLVLSQELFSFGSKVYQLFQPHFMGEFLQENKDVIMHTGCTNP